MGRLNALCFGEILFDRIEGKDHFGGAPANVAVHLSRLGARSYMLSSLGSDSLGDHAREILVREGVGTEYIGIDTLRPTGVVDVALGEGIPSYEVRENAAWDHIGTEQLSALSREHWDLLYCGTLAQRSEQSRATISRLLQDLSYDHLFFDVNLRQSYYSAPVIGDTLKYTSLLKLSDEELPLLSTMLMGEERVGPQFFQELIGGYPLEMMILTRGAKGADFYFRSLPDEVYSVGAGQVPVVDTVGAGDSFSAAFLFYFLSGDRLYKAAEKAGLLADYVVSRTGALPEMNREIRTRLGLRTRE